MHITEAFSKFILDIVTIPWKIPHLTCSLSYCRYSNWQNVVICVNLAKRRMCVARVSATPTDREV